MSTIDLNCDLGEGFPHDDELMQLVTSANVCCGGHAGDWSTSARTLALARDAQVQIGAHPGFVDREHFGRRELERSYAEIVQECVWQIGALSALAHEMGVKIAYLKPHGALYNLACRHERYALPIVEVAERYDLPLLGLPNSSLESASEGRCAFIAEGFADRRYRNGALVPRSEADAFVSDPEEAVAQVKGLMRQVQTLCVHGDNPEAVQFVRALRASLESEGIRIAAFRNQS